MNNEQVDRWSWIGDGGTATTTEQTGILISLPVNRCKHTKKVSRCSDPRAKKTNVKEDTQEKVARSVAVEEVDDALLHCVCCCCGGGRTVDNDATTTTS